MFYLLTHKEMAKIIVTGGAGFIGSHLVDSLVENGNDVVVIDNLYTGKLEYINPKAKLYLCDVRDDSLNKIFEIEKPDVVFNLAAQMSVPYSVENPEFDLDVNVRGILNLLQASVKNNVKKFVFSSSGGAVYGDAKEYPTTENYPPEPFSPYAITKFMSEFYLKFYKNHHNLNYSICRFANVYGPRQASAHESGVVTIFITKVLNSEPAMIYTYPHQSGGMLRDYIYVSDVVSGLIKAMNHPDSDVFNIGTGEPSSTLELFEEIKKISGISVEHKFGPPRQGDLMQNCLNIDKSKSVLGWEPEFDLDKGLTLTIDYFKKLK